MKFATPNAEVFVLRNRPSYQGRLFCAKGELVRAFSLVEVLAAIAIIGIITFLAIPNILKIKEDGERSLAVSRAAALNMAMASFLQAKGQAAAQALWTGDQNTRYALLSSYLAFAPDTLDEFVPEGYEIELPDDIFPLAPATVTDPNNAPVNY